ncbi:hypothetical protein P154DRAFT_484877 [Amniculicola lignicola CBS 123094]|uniref:N-acetyltransferase domain-containing protein n=1 Tax=Amniculicola lignicola CBS 123094 TaxID=1392246 RepID=A0A6A5WVM0_9PLEO|nr:hypothetical protein P154DRAFT_484877 [Amniculicola lignicola CBS 123094]
MSANRVRTCRLPFITAKNEQGEVIGYAYCGTFRERKGYRHTVELSLFCRFDSVGKGVGAQLLTKVIDIIKEPGEFPEYITTPRSEDDKVRMVMACMSVDETSWNNGLGLRDFYIRHGFEQVGYMNKVGEKMGRWIDVCYLQLSVW